MGPRNLLILFFSTVAVSLVILIIFFSLFFKGVDLNFNTRLPESAPDIGRQFSGNSTMSPDSKADGIMRSTVNVPPEMKEAEPSQKAGLDDHDFVDSDLPPVSDDALLEAEPPLPMPDKLSSPDARDKTAEEKQSTSNRADRLPPPPPAPAPRSPQTMERPRHLEPQQMTPVVPMEAHSRPVEDAMPVGPPVPGQ